MYLRKCQVRQMRISTNVKLRNCRVAQRTGVTCLWIVASSTTSTFRPTKSCSRKRSESMPASQRTARKWHYHFETSGEGPIMNPATLVTPPVTWGFLLTAWSTTKLSPTPRRMPRWSPPTATPKPPVSLGEASCISTSAKEHLTVVKSSSAKGISAKATPASDIARLALASGSTLRKLSRIRDDSPSKGMATQTRRKTNASEITDEASSVEARTSEGRKEE